MDGIKKCEKCGCEDFTEVTTDTLDMLETEKDRLCNGCGGVMDSWVYGFWESGRNKHEGKSPLLPVEHKPTKDNCLSCGVDIPKKEGEYLCNACFFEAGI